MFILRRIIISTRWRWLLPCLLIAGVIGSAAPARADDKIWSALILASNVDAPREPASELVPFQKKVQRFFGYNQLQLIGSATKTVNEDCEKWLVPSQNFWLNVKARATKKGEKPEGGYMADVVLFHDKRKLVQTEATLAPRSPLIIRGPMHARGQLLIVLQVQP